MILDIVIEPNKILHQVAKNLTPNEMTSDETKKLIESLIETMHSKDSVGIAAPQIGKSAQICVITKNFAPDKTKDVVLINPKWEKASILKTVDEEGCLSVPKIYGQVKRHKKIKVSALDENGKKINFVADDLFARIIQHEIDHLNGVLFIEKAKKLRTIKEETM